MSMLIKSLSHTSRKQLENSRRVDIVWDTYIPNSIKESTREKRGKGVRRRLQATTSSHQTGQTSYVIQELFAFLSDQITTVDFPENKEIGITSGVTIDQWYHVIMKKQTLGC